jgi:putative nucleotidyltransferase with HDIG domain
MSIFQKIRAAKADLTTPVLTYIGLLYAAAVLIAAALVHEHVGFGNFPAVVCLAVVAILSDRGRIELKSTRLLVSISLFPAVFTAVLFGPLAAMLVYGVSLIGLTGFPIAGRIAYLPCRMLTGAAAAGAAVVATNFMAGGAGEIIVASACAALVAELVDTSSATLMSYLRGVGSFRDLLADVLPVIASSVLMYTPAVALLVLAYRDVSPWTLPLFFGPAVAAQRWFLMYQEQRRLAADLTTVNAQLQSANLSFAKGLIATLDARDRYTAGHSAAVALYASDISSRMGFDEAQQELAYLCGLVHDIGKIGLPAGLLEKPGALTLDERREMQRHSEIGEGILAKVDTYAEIAAVVRHHHERVDGQGYPDGLSGTQIPMLSRIIAVADAYNAMTSDRPYRDAMPSRVARLRLAQAVETQFDTSVVAAFEAILAGASEAYRTATGPDFQLLSEPTHDVEDGPLTVAAIA